jgi:glyoxylase-like metal-dependent hydrolase (beta-lactamase superfamily II)
MKLQPIAQQTFLIPGANNLGIIAADSGDAIAIDTGLNKDAARTLRRALEETGLTLRAIISTHHHADHIGGNAYILRSLPDVHIYAPPLEAALIEHPILEPVYLNLGARPTDALRNRWLLAQPAPVHHIISSLEQVEKGTSHTLDIAGLSLEVIPLPGHSIAQVGVAFEGVCFATDGFFGSEVIVKHGVPYAHDVAAQLASLDRLAQRTEEWFVPGHGTLTPRSELDGVLQTNREAINRASEMVLQALPGDIATVTTQVRAMLHQHSGERSLPAMGIPQYAILSGAIAAHLSFLEQQGQARLDLDERGLMWQRT